MGGLGRRPQRVTGTTFTRTSSARRVHTDLTWPDCFLYQGAACRWQKDLFWGNFNFPKQEKGLIGCLPRWTLFRFPSVLPCSLPTPSPFRLLIVPWTWAGSWSTKKHSDTINTNPNKYSKSQPEPLPSIHLVHYFCF